MSNSKSCRKNLLQLANEKIRCHLRDLERYGFIDTLGTILVLIVLAATALAILGAVMKFDSAEFLGLEDPMFHVTAGGKWFERCKCPSFIHYLNKLFSPGWGNKDSRKSGKKF